MPGYHGLARPLGRLRPACSDVPVRRPWLLLVVVLWAGRARALDKQGSAHADGTSGAEGFEVSGAVTFGSALYNRSYAARPDNSGLAMFRYAAHADVDLLGPRLSIPLDVNVFTDRRRGGLGAAAPSELDLIGGLTTTWPVLGGSVEVGTRLEHDRPVDRPCAPGAALCTQSYVDVRARYLFALSRAVPGLARGLRGGDVSGAFTLGAFAWNPTYAARPDNTGKALLRIAPHVELSLLDDLLSFGFDFTMFTDRTRSALRPSELDVTQEVIVHVSPWEVHVAYERDLPIDRPGYAQSFVYALLAWNFRASGATPAPLEQRGSVLSP